MSEKLVDLEEILCTLRDHDLSSSDAVARELDLHRLDARLALLDAANWGLIRRDRRRAWMLTDRGEALITAGDLGEVHDRGGSRGRPLARRSAVSERRESSPSPAVELVRQLWSAHGVLLVVSLVAAAAVIVLATARPVSHSAATSTALASKSTVGAHRPAVKSEPPSFALGSARSGPRAIARHFERARMR